MKKNEIVINGVHHVLVEDGYCSCVSCSLREECGKQYAKYAQLCDLLEGRLHSHFEVKSKAISKEEFNIVVQVMSLLRCGKISTLTPNCDVREILLAEKIE